MRTIYLQRAANLHLTHTHAQTIAVIVGMPLVYRSHPAHLDRAKLSSRSVSQHADFVPLGADDDHEALVNHTELNDNDL